MAREEILANVVRWARVVIEDYFASTAQLVHVDRLLHVRFPDELWRRIERFLINLAGLPCWSDRNLASTVFGPKQSPDFWEHVFATGEAPNGTRIRAQGLNLSEMIRDPGSERRAP